MENERTPMSGTGTMDRVITQCRRHGLFAAPTDNLHDSIRLRCGATCIRVDNIVFHANAHSTGCDVWAWVVDGADALEVRNTTYWYSHNYTFNKPHNKYGAWDEAIGAALVRMASEVEKRELWHAGQSAREAQRKADEDRAVNDRFGKLFA